MPEDAMPPKVKLALALVAVATLVSSALLAASGSAAPTPKRPSRQQLAQQLLAKGRARFMTAPARTWLNMMATGSRAMSPDAGGPAAGREAPGGERAAVAAEPAAAFPNVRVNDPAADRQFLDQTTQSETAIAVHGSNVAVGYNDSQRTPLFTTAASSITGFSWSSDGGRSFHDGGALRNAPGQINLGDPWMTGDRSGAFYFGNLAIDTFLNLGISVARSNDGGRTWGTPVEVIDTAPFLFYFGDKDAIVAGRDPAVPGRDNTYAAWDDDAVGADGVELLGLPVARSTDGGRTGQVTYADRFNFSTAPGCSFQQYIGAQPFVDPANGTLSVAAEKIVVDDPDCQGVPAVRSEVIFTSTDGGRTFGPGVTIATVTPAAAPAHGFSDVLFLDPGRAIRTLEFPVLAKVGGALYAAWNDGAQGPSHIRLASSTDGGAHWTVTWATAGGANELQPALSGDAAGLHLLYYRVERDNSINVLLQDRRGAATTTRRVNTATFRGSLNAPQFDPIIAQFYMGDYIANVTDGSHRAFAWGDNRDVVRNSLWPQGRNDPDVFFARD
jgi:hypothetical protein